MRISVVSTIAAVIVLLMTGTADAKRPALSQKEADNAAQISVEFQTAFYDGEATYEIDPCEDVGRSKAECDYTVYFDDGDVCDDTVTVWKTRRGTILTETEEEMTCDSDESGV